jgi:hypothetical protein
MTPLVILSSDEIVTPKRAAKEVGCAARTIQLAIGREQLAALPVDGGRRFVLRLSDVCEFRRRYRLNRTARGIAKRLRGAV